MKLQLWINNTLFNEMHLPPDVFDRISTEEVTCREACNHRRQVIINMAADLKGLFWNQISKAKRWEIFLSVESEMSGNDYEYSEFMKAI